MGERIRNATVTRIETDYIEPCKCTVVKIYTDLKMGKQNARFMAERRIYKWQAKQIVQLKIQVF